MFIAQLEILPAWYVYLNIDSLSPVSGMMELVTHQPLQYGEFPPWKARKSLKHPIAIPKDKNCNGFDVYYRDASTPSFFSIQPTLHYLGKNFGAQSWLYWS